MPPHSHRPPSLSKADADKFAYARGWEGVKGGWDEDQKQEAWKASFVAPNQTAFCEATAQPGLFALAAAASFFHLSSDNSLVR